MADSIRGDGLSIADRRLAALAQDPERLERERARFSESPPSYRSRLSGTTTRSSSPEDHRTEVEKRREELKWQLIYEQGRSTVRNQWDQQVCQERVRIDQDLENGTIHFVRDGRNQHLEADFIVKTRWIEQGIWKDEWNDQSFPDGQWKHEVPPPPEPEPLRTIFDSPPSPPLPRSDEEIQREKRERDASRPIFQFFYQVSKERERILNDLNPPPALVCPPKKPMLANVMGFGRGGTPPRHLWLVDEEKTRKFEKSRKEMPRDVNTTAYETVKTRWIEWDIWNTSWGVLPGMSWNHEQDLEEFLQERMGDDPEAEDAAEVDDNQRSVPTVDYGWPAEVPRNRGFQFGFDLLGEKYGIMGLFGDNQRYEQPLGVKPHWSPGFETTGRGRFAESPPREEQKEIPGGVGDNQRSAQPSNHDFPSVFSFGAQGGQHEVLGRGFFAASESPPDTADTFSNANGEGSLELQSRRQSSTSHRNGMSRQSSESLTVGLTAPQHAPRIKSPSSPHGVADNSGLPGPPRSSPPGRKRPQRRAAQPVEPEPQPAVLKPVRPGRVTKAAKPKPPPRSRQLKRPAKTDLSTGPGPSTAHPVNEAGNTSVNGTPRRSQRLRVLSANQSPAEANSRSEPPATTRPGTKRAAVETAAAKPEGAKKRRGGQRTL